MYFVDSGASLHMTGDSCLTSQEREIKKTNSYPEILTASGIVRSIKEAKVYIPEVGTNFYVKLVDDSPSVLSLARQNVELGYSYSWQPGENPKFTKGNKTITGCTDNFVPIVVVTPQNATPSLDANLRRCDLIHETPPHLCDPC